MLVQVRELVDISSREHRFVKNLVMLNVTKMVAAYIIQAPMIEQVDRKYYPVFYKSHIYIKLFCKFC